MSDALFNYLKLLVILKIMDTETAKCYFGHNNTCMDYIYDIFLGNRVYVLVCN